MAWAGSFTRLQGPGAISTSLRCRTLFAVSDSPVSLLDVKLEITLGSLSHDDAFELDTVLALDAGSDGIDPTTEDVTLQVGSYTVTVGAGSFAPDRNGRIVFEGIIDDVLLWK